jgi:hypothetical protein
MGAITISAGSVSVSSNILGYAQYHNVPRPSQQGCLVQSRDPSQSSASNRPEKERSLTPEGGEERECHEAPSSDSDADTADNPRKLTAAMSRWDRTLHQLFAAGVGAISPSKISTVRSPLPSSAQATASEPDRISHHQSTAVIHAAQLLVIHPAGLSPTSVNTSTVLSHHSLRSSPSSTQTAYHLAAMISGPALQAKPLGRPATPCKMNDAERRIESAASLAAV